ncbi:MAG: PHP domain-containing protein, partial [Alistipes sp.]|nr:PHP domain-containing protein [Alistipes sp.]
MHDFVHLHVHSQYSILDGQASIQRLVDKAIADGQKGIALTDHGNMFGVKEFWNYVKKKNGARRDKLKEVSKKVADLQAEVDAAEAPTEEQLAELARLKAELDSLPKEEFKAIIGCEVYVARRGLHLKDKSHKEDMGGYHLILLAKNATGYHNLIKIVSKAWTEGYYMRPRTDRVELEKYHEGLICCSACLGGEIPRKLQEGNMAAAEEAVLWYKNLFG